MTTIEELRKLMAEADDAVRKNVPQDEAHIYVKRGDNECCVAVPQCREWARYIGALIGNGPALLAVVEAAQSLHVALDRWSAPCPADVADANCDLRNALAPFTKPKE